MYRQSSYRSRENTRSDSPPSEQSRPRGRSRGRSRDRYYNTQPVMGPPGMMMGPPPGASGPYPGAPDLLDGPPGGFYGPPSGHPIGLSRGPPTGPTEYYPGMPGPEGIPTDALGRPMSVPIGYGPPGRVMVGPDGLLMHSIRREDSRERGKKRRQKKRDGSGLRHRSKSRGRQGDPLDQWADWRQQMNESISADLTENRFRRIEMGDDFNDLARPRTKASEGGVYKYSTTIDQATALHKDDYITFGIPRIQLGRERDRKNRERSPTRRRRRSRSSSQSPDEESDRRTNETPYYTITKIKDHKKAEKVQQHMPPRYHASNGELDYRSGFPGMERMHADHPSSKGSRDHRNGYH